MQITLTAAGSPAEIQSSLNRDAARERTADADAGGVAQAVRDYVAKKTGAADVLVGDKEPPNYTVSAEIKITIEEHASASDAELARLARVGGQPFNRPPQPSGAGSSASYVGDKSLGTGVDVSAGVRRRAADAAEARIDAENAGKLK